MKIAHVENVHAVCPQEPVFDYYEVRFETDAVVPVERIREALLKIAGETLYQEELTQQLANRTRCVVTTTGLHRTTRTTVTCTP